MKTEFCLQEIRDYKIVDSSEKVKIVGTAPKYSAYVVIETNIGNLFFKDKDLERFARNVLKAIGKK